MTIETFDLATITLHNRDVEEKGAPEPVAAFREAIDRADGVLIAAEYQFVISGVLKNAVDRASRPLGNSVTE